MQGNEMDFNPWHFMYQQNQKPKNDDKTQKNGENITYKHGRKIYSLHLYEPRARTSNIVLCVYIKYGLIQ